MGHYVDEGICSKHGEWYAKHARCGECEDAEGAELNHLRAEMVRLGLELNKREAEIERLEQTVKYKDKGLFDMAVELTAKSARLSGLESDNADLRAENERLTAECEELRADVVFVARHVGLSRTYDGRCYVNTAVKSHPYNGTDADIPRAVREARNGVS